MEKIAPGKFEVTLSGEVRTVVLSFGIRSDVLLIITKKQLEYRGITSQNMLPTEMRAKLAELVEALDAERDKEVKNQARIDELQEQVNKQYEESIKVIDENKDRITSELAIGMIDLTDDAIAEILAKVLTKRDKEGKVITEVTKEQILHGEEFVNDGDELLSLIEGIMEYTINSLKKIASVSQMVSNLVKPD